MSEAVYHQYILRLQSLGRKEPVTFVVDGLEDSERADRQTTLDIVSELPSVQSEFRFLITGSERLYRELNLQKRNAVRIPPFTLSEPETESYLSDLEMGETDVRAFHVYTGGNIGSLHKVRTLLAAGTSIDDLLSEKKGTLAKLFEHEWAGLQAEEATESLLALIVFSHVPLTTRALSELTSFPESEIERQLRRCRFLDMSGSVWSIRAEAQRRFIADKLQHLRRRVEDQLIDRLFSKSEEHDSVVALPSQLVSAGKHVEALKVLTGEHFAQLLSHEGSLRSLKKHAEFGVISARSGGDTFSELRFSIIQSAINGTTLAASSTYEIEALLSLDLDDAAAALALTASTAEERLRQLAAAAGCFGKKGKTPPEQVVATVRELLKELESELTEPVLINIAADLLQVDQDLALQILEKAASSERADKAPSNQAGTSEARAAKDQSTDEPVAQVEAASRLRPVLDAAEFFVKKMPADELLKRISALGDSHKLFLLQRWLEVHRTNHRASEIALLALDIVLRDTSKPPKLRDLREIAIVVPHIADRQLSERVISRLEAQSSELTSHGTSEDAVRFKMLLLRAKQRWSPEAIDGDLIDLFAQVHGVADVGIRTACYAWMLYHLGLLCDKYAIENRTGVIAETTTHLLEAIDLLLGQTAEHYTAAVDAIRAICMAAPERAIELVRRFNTRERRDKGFSAIVRCLAVNKTYNDYAHIAVTGIESVTESEQREKLIVFLLHRITNDQAADNSLPVEPRLLVLWKKILHSTRKVQSLILTHKIIATSASLRKPMTLLTTAKDLWCDISDSSSKVSVGYWAVSELAPADREAAEEWLHMVREEARSSGAPSFMAGSQLFLTAELAGRVFARFVSEFPQEFDTALARLSNVVRMIPALDEQAQIWAEVGTCLFFRAKRDLSQRVVETKIEPILATDFTNDIPLQRQIVINVAPLLYLTAADSANARIERVLTSEEGDVARDAIAATILRKMLPSDFFQERERMEFQLSYSEAVAVLAQLKAIKSDSLIYRNVSRLCNSLCSRKNRISIRRNQVADILVDLKATVEKSLPDEQNIKHEGFLIACLAEILRCQIAETKQRDSGQWLALLDRSKKIENRADRVIVVSIVASCANGGGPFADGKWFEEVLSDVQNIPSDRDRVERYQWVAQILEPFDKPKCRITLKAGMLASTHIRDTGAMDKRQRILDLAHNIDPSFVDELIDLLDEDQANEAPRSLLKEHLKLLDARKEAASDVSRLSLHDYSVADLTEIAVRNIGAMNADRQIPQSVKLFMDLAEKSKRFPFMLTYPVWLWIIESALRKSTQQNAQRALPSFFENICCAAELAVNLLTRSGGGQRAPLLNVGETIVGPGARDQLFARVRKWIAEQAGAEIFISDPYFGPNDLDVVKTIAEVCPEKELTILTSREEINRATKGASAEEAFREAWDEMCEGGPPQTDVVVVGYGTEGKHPIHDRWIVSSGGGLRLGTSTNSMGTVRISEISEMDVSQAAEKINAIKHVLDRSTRHWDGQKLHRSRFTL
ncbi:hypothetical protein [Caballeronia catudaia]|uniref:hypothetical protein n=1 Tax=Caballeronia catudaia TaxID=1777136 RepID=UPI00117CA7AC|nr:hypothetical protein [Caballeronia catudaia]